MVGTLGVIAARAHTATQAITAGAVGTVGGGLSGFISKTFNTTYKETLAQNNAYFHEPVVMARLLAAERLLAEYGDDKAEKGKALTAMITAAVAFDIGSVPTPPTIADGS
ncbi:MAG: hypothetical protein JWM34_602 [Ilumatobacteraceae bacterium]|nr:hypothetical protein [Ilumatobacteraceae bacterium]